MHSDFMERMQAMKSRQGGVTLIELLTVVVIIAILASVAIPSYRRYLIRTNRADAKTALMQLQAAEEKFYLQNNAYTANVADAAPNGLGLTEQTVNGFYAIKVELGDGDQTYVATATPIDDGGQADDKECKSFTITDVGKRGIVDGSKDAVYCWK